MFLCYCFKVNDLRELGKKYFAILQSSVCRAFRLIYILTSECFLSVHSTGVFFFQDSFNGVVRTKSLKNLKQNPSVDIHYKDITVWH